jgi:DNA-binding transcriptional MerR regulator
MIDLLQKYCTNLNVPLKDIGELLEKRSAPSKEEIDIDLPYV